MAPSCPTAASILAVNRAIGDLSFEEKYGSSPSPATAESLRIQTHLQYVEQLIRCRSEGDAINSKKLDSLKHLNDYWKQGNFPQHDISSAGTDLRKPRFIDHRNVHCAVGYLILKSAGFEQLPREINLRNEYSYIDEIENENLKNWMDLYGYTLEELQMIQPTYQHMREIPPQTPRETRRGILGYVSNGFRSFSQLIGRCFGK